MRVECHSVGAFLQELALEADEGRVWKRIVRVETRRHAEQDEETTFTVGFHASALIGEQGQPPTELLHCDCVAGQDGYARLHGVKHDPEAGSKQAAAWTEQVQALANEKGLTVRPGKYELV